VKRDPAQSLAEVEVTPAAALDRSRELMFVWLPTGTQAPGAAPGSAPVAAPTTAPTAVPTAATAAHPDANKPPVATTPPVATKK
jgi:hypothetical protein